MRAMEFGCYWRRSRRDAIRLDCVYGGAAGGVKSDVVTCCAGGKLDRGRRLERGMMGHGLLLQLVHKEHGRALASTVTPNMPGDAAAAAATATQPL